jgi:hypothetical protein
MEQLALTKIFLLTGKIGGCGIRVPVADGFNGYYIQRKPCRHNR